MKIGELRHKIALFVKEQIEETDGAGVYTTLVEVARVWADIQNINGLTQLDTKQIGEEVTHKVTLRYFPFISSQHWMKLGVRNFEIKSVRNINERNQWLELLVREVFDDTNNQILAGIGHANDPIES